MTEPVNLDWSTAKVSDGTLTVALDDKPPKQWREAFERTAGLLGTGTWTVAVRAKKGLVQIAPVRPGDEERVRQLLEGAVLEANTKATVRAEPSQDGDDERAEGEADRSDSEPSPDEALADRFRDFADPQ